MRPRHQQLLQAASRAGGGGFSGRHGSRRGDGGQHPRGWRQALAHDCFPPVVGAMGAVFLLNLLWTARLSQLEGRAIMHQNNLMAGGGGALDGGEYEFITAGEEDNGGTGGGGGRQQQHPDGSAHSSPSSMPGGDGSGAAPEEPRGGWHGWMTRAGGAGGTAGAALERLAHARPSTTGQTNAERIQAMLRFGGGGLQPGAPRGDITDGSIDADAAGGHGEGGSTSEGGVSSLSSSITSGGGGGEERDEEAAAAAAAALASSSKEKKEEEEQEEEEEEEEERAAEREKERLARAERARARAAREKEIARRKAALDKRIEQQQQLRAKQQQGQQLTRREEEERQQSAGEEGEGGGEPRHSREGEKEDGGGVAGGGAEDSKAGNRDKVRDMEEGDNRATAGGARGGARAGAVGDAEDVGGGGHAVDRGDHLQKKDEDKPERSVERPKTTEDKKSPSQPRSVPRRAGGGGGGGGGTNQAEQGTVNSATNEGDGGGGGGVGGVSHSSPSPPAAVVVALQPTIGHPLPPKIQRILKKLTETPAVLTNRRLRDHTRISCGGTGAVSFKTWPSFFHAAENLTRTLPDADPPLIKYAIHAQQHCRHRGACDFTKVREEEEEEVGVGAEAAAAGKLNDGNVVVPTKMSSSLSSSLSSSSSSSSSSPPSCAVVGNGGRLRYETHGDEIDAADVVVRFNNGRTKGFERQVGRRSNFRFYNGPSVEPKQGGELTVAQLRDPAVSHWAKQYLKYRDNFPEAYVMDPEVICHAWDMVDREGDKPSSGLVGIAWAMRLCRSVDVYGFQFDAYFNASMRPHYYDWERPKPGREHAHPFEKERELYLSLAAAGLLTLH